MIARIKLNDEYIKIRQATQLGYALCIVGGVADLSFPTSQTRRGRTEDMGNICPTLTTTNVFYVFEEG